MAHVDLAGGGGGNQGGAVFGEVGDGGFCPLHECIQLSHFAANMLSNQFCIEPLDPVASLSYW